MRLQLSCFPVASVAIVAAGVASGASSARADDRVDFTTTWFQEQRAGASNLTIIHPQFDLGVDIGENTELGVKYQADVVSGATASVYSVDAVSSATEFDDYRQAGTVSLGFSGRRAGFSLSGTFGTERDYLSLSVSAGANVDLPGKNTNLALSYTRNFDEVCDRDNSLLSPLERRALSVEECNKDGVFFGEDDILGSGTVWRDLSIDTAQATVTQNVSPTMVGQLSLYGSILNGFQANPYRRVRVSGVEAQENLPSTRQRIALTGRIKKFLPSTNSAVGGTLRGYADSWGVESVTAEMDFYQYFGRALLLRFRGRLYAQNEAVFFKDAFFYETEGPAGEFFTGDRELAPLRQAMGGAKLSYIAARDDEGEVWGLFDEVLLNVKFEALFYDEAAAGDDSMNLAGRDGQFLNQALLDAVVLQLSLRMAY